MSVLNGYFDNWKLRKSALPTINLSDITMDNGIVPISNIESYDNGTNTFNKYLLRAYNGTNSYQKLKDCDDGTLSNMNIYINYFKAMCSDQSYTKIDCNKLNVWETQLYGVLQCYNDTNGWIWYKMTHINEFNCNFLDASFIPNSSIDFTKIKPNGITYDCLTTSLQTKIDNINVVWLDGWKIINGTIDASIKVVSGWITNNCFLDSWISWNRIDFQDGFITQTNATQLFSILEQQNNLIIKLREDLETLRLFVKNSMTWINTQIVAPVNNNLLTPQS